MLVVFTIFLGCFVSAHGKYTEKAHCPKNHDCVWEYPYYITQNMKCTENNQCPPGFLCCPDCHYQHRVCKAALWVPKNKNEVPELTNRCPKNPTVCKQQFPLLDTKIYECTSDDDCDSGFVCCKDDCYEHQICKKSTEIEEATKVCPMDSKTCLRPLPYGTTKKYECTAHAQCRKTHVCCFDSCYTHKICKPKRKIRNLNKTCPLTVRQQSCPNTNRTLSKYLCETDDDCLSGYICCEDNCYDHKVCKLPNEAFSHRSIYKPKNVTNSSFEEQYKCPKVEEKCTKPYSLRLAKKFICFKDEDCKLGQVCCKDSCVKDFRICKNLFTLAPKFKLVTLEAGTSQIFDDLILDTSSIPSNVNKTRKNLNFDV